MKGYKIFEYNWKCRGFQYAVGETARAEGAPQLCKRGFHFCARAVDCLVFYPLEGHRYAEVRADGDIVGDEQSTKFATNALTVVREIPYEEFKNMCTGVTSLYHSNNQISCTSTLHEGIRHGPYKEWLSTGQLYREGEFLNGNREGIWSQYINGIKYTSVWRNGILLAQ